MDRRALTDKAVLALKTGPDRYMVGDKIASALIIQVGVSGTKTWLWRGRLDGKVKVVTLGRYPAMSLDQAWVKAGEITQGQLSGVNIIAEKARVAADDAKLSERTMDWLFERYMEAEGPSLRTADAKRRTYNKSIKPVIGSRSIYKITHDDLAAILADRAVKFPGGSNEDQKFLSRLFRWAVTTGRSTTGLKVNPAADLVKLTKIGSRDRYLSDREIGYFYSALPRLDSPLATILRLLILTGKRRNEVVEMSWDEVDLDQAIWTIPAARSKNKTEDVVPLSKPVVDILKGLTRHKTSKMVFWSHKTPENAFSGFGKVTDRFRAMMEEEAAKDDRKIEPWVIHDLRRTVASGMSGLMDADHRPLIQTVVVEAVLNHLTGARSSVAGIYNRHSYFHEKRAALILWADHLAVIEKRALAPTVQPASEEKVCAPA